jgi:hypothetical protein
MPTLSGGRSMKVPAWAPSGYTFDVLPNVECAMTVSPQLEGRQSPRATAQQEDGLVVDVKATVVARRHVDGGTMHGTKGGGGGQEGRKVEHDGIELESEARCGKVNGAEGAVRRGMGMGMAGMVSHPHVFIAAYTLP